MGRATMKIGEDEYFEWSTVTDSPITYLMTREEMALWLLEEYESVFMWDADAVEERLARTDLLNTSSKLESEKQSFDDLLNWAAETEEDKITIEEFRKEFTAPILIRHKRKTKPSTRAS